ncbi:MAG: DUF937 domain-containing protein [Hyphomicrobiales bacterium]|nr:DUF937 domain-containing protein [Hyphomicrobiales bacterium]
MIPLVEMMLKSLDGDGFTQIKQQFGLDSKETERALEAVLPAFSTGLKRNTAQPKDFGAFMHTLSEGRHEKYVDDTNTAFSDEGKRDGNGILKHLFGSKNTSRALAAQAAKASGVDEETIKKILPVVASMVMGGLFKQSTGQTDNITGVKATGNTSTSNFSGGGILGDILGELVKGGLSRQDRSKTRKKSRGRGQKDNPLGDLLEQMMGRSSSSPDKQAKTPYGGDNPLGQIFENMLDGKRGDYQPQKDIPVKPRRKKNKPVYDDSDDGFEDIGPADQYRQQRRGRKTSENPQPGRSSQKRGSGGLEDLFGDMFETGREVDEGYQQGVESIFDQFMKR